MEAVTAAAATAKAPATNALPPMSADGGSQEEFEKYWDSNTEPQRYGGNWVERLSHPQVNIEPYWYNESSGETRWTKPKPARKLRAKETDDGLQALAGDGPEWEMSIMELKEALHDGRDKSLGLRTEQLAQRAVAEYENFVPRVLSWHDYQYHTFWFFGGMKRKRRATSGSRSFFDQTGGASNELFASREFFLAAAEVLMSRLHRMHPICLTYFIWTYTRAGVVVPELMEKVGTHLCNGLLPTMDRCSLGTMVWNFTKQGVRHDHLFADATKELSRPNRLRSLSARNFQNVIIAYSRGGYLHPELFEAMARGIPRLLDLHDPKLPKNERHVLFAYTCKDGSEVLADSFRISNLTVILKGFAKMRPPVPSMERTLGSMADYVRRSQERSPAMMRDKDDVPDFLGVFAWVASKHKIDVGEIVHDSFNLGPIMHGMEANKARNLRHKLSAVGVPVAA